MRFLFFLLLCAPLVSSGAVPHVDFTPRPGATVPGELKFQEGGPVRLGDYFGGAPVVLVLGYLGCVNLCSTTVTGVSEALGRTGLTAGIDYVALFVSIDPRDEKSKPTRKPGWHFLTGADSAAVVARKVGFQYAYDAASGQFAHPAGFVVLNPLGAVSAYFPGVRFDSEALRSAIQSASRGEAPGVIEHLLLVCFHDPVNGRYSAAVLTALRIAIFAFVAGVGFLAWRRL
jgi:protein SCO1/2